MSEPELTVENAEIRFNADRWTVSDNSYRIQFRRGDGGSQTIIVSESEYERVKELFEG